MSFDQIERSNYDGKPVVLYEFTLGESVWRYAGAQNDIEIGGVLYEALPIAHEGYSMSGNPDEDDLSIRISLRAAVTSLFNGTPPSRSLQISVRTVHFGDEEAPVVWSGIVKSMKRVSTVEATFNCNSLLSTLNRNGLRLSWQRGCPHALYDGLCRVNPDHYATAIQVQAVTGDHVESSGATALPNGYLNGGYLSFVSEHGVTETRAIEEHWQHRIRLLGLTDGIAVGQWIIVYPGCDRTSSTCVNKFNNLSNYGGFPHLPNKSPFDGDPVF